jgi:hypothetical protein
VIRVGSKETKVEALVVDPAEETANPQPFLSEILVSEPSNTVLSNFSLKLVPLKLLELLWEMMEDLKVLPMLSSNPLRLPVKLLSLMARPLMTDN